MKKNLFEIFLTSPFIKSKEWLNLIFKVSRINGIFKSWNLWIYIENNYMEDKNKKGSKVIVKFGEAFKYKDMGFTDNGKTSENKAVARKTMDMIKTLWEVCKCR